MSILQPTEEKPNTVKFIIHRVENEPELRIEDVSSIERNVFPYVMDEETMKLDEGDLVDKIFFMFYDQGKFTRDDAIVVRHYRNVGMDEPGATWEELRRLGFHVKDGGMRFSTKKEN